LESDLAEVRDELGKLKISEAAAGRTSASARKVEPPESAPAAAAVAALLKQPALWFAVAGWAVAVVLLFRRRSV
jgi:hypothetical protein